MSRSTYCSSLLISVVLDISMNISSIILSCTIRSSLSYIVSICTYYDSLLTVGVHDLEDGESQAEQITLGQIGDHWLMIARRYLVENLRGA